MGVTCENSNEDRKTNSAKICYYNSSKRKKVIKKNTNIIVINENNENYKNEKTNDKGNNKKIKKKINNENTYRNNNNKTFVQNSLNTNDFEKKILLSDEEKNFNFETKYPIQYNSINLENNLDEFSRNSKIQDSVFENEQSDDEIYLLLKKKEKEELTKFFNDKKSELLNFLKNKIENNNNDNFNYNDIVKSIIKSEKADNIYQKKIMKEVLKIKKNREEFKINFLTIMLVGKSGVGKSTLINNLLKLDENERAETGTGNYITTNIKSYQSSYVPFLKLIDTRGIELNVGFGAEDVKKQAIEYINEQNRSNDSNNFVQCIWYCITGSRLEEAEIKLLNSLKSAYGENQLPIIIVYTQAVDKSLTSQIKNYIKEKKINGEFVDILAERKELIDDEYLEPFGLDILINKTLKKCKKAFKGEMAKVMTKNLSNDIFEKLKRENNYIKNYIYERCIMDFIANYALINVYKEFIEYIIKIFGINVQYFLKINNKMIEINDESYKCFNESYVIQTCTKKYIKDYTEFTKKLIGPILRKYAIEFLDEQVAIQLDNNKEIE